MTDPALLHLVQHLNQTPAAIIWQAPMAPSKPLMLAFFELQVAERERSAREWLAKLPAVMSEVREAVEGDPHAWTPEIFTAIIDQFETGLRVQSRITAKHARRIAEQSEDRSSRSLELRLLKSQEALYAGAVDFALWLRAMRAEVSPMSRGGPVFDDADALERYLLTSAA